MFSYSLSSEIEGRENAWASHKHRWVSVEGFGTQVAVTRLQEPPLGTVYNGYKEHRNVQALAGGRNAHFEILPT